VTVSRLVVPESATCGLLILSGSSGRVLAERADVLSSYGVAALAVPWFGVEGLPASPRRVPLEALLPHLDQLASVVPRVGVMGTSFGAEAALLLAVRDPRISLVVALAPTSVAWETSDQDGDGPPGRDAKWTWGGTPILGVPYVDATIRGPFADAREWHEASLGACDDPDQFAIPVDRITGDVIVASGGDDRVWQAEQFCEEIVARRSAAGLMTTHVHHPGAGHQVVLPGEAPAPDRPGFPRGGSPTADAELGATVLEAVLQACSDIGP
jgi:dienelactone hydrolase